MIKKILRKIKNLILPPNYFIKGLNSGYNNLKYKALLYYKTESLSNKRSIKSYTHTNLWEVTEIVSILNRFGFEVDVVDRMLTNFMPEDKYDLFIGLSAGNSGKFFGKYAKALSKAVKIAYVLGPEPRFSDECVIARYDEFKERTGIDAPPMRTYTSINFDEFANLANYIFCFGEDGVFSFNSYKKYNKPIYSIMPGTSPDINFNPAWLKTRNRKHFLCFAGGGFICKGVDLIVEAFQKMPEYKITICGPDNEKAFFDAYGKTLQNNPNINFEGFVKVGGNRFQKLCEECSFVIFHSSSEGCCTSVATGIRAGLVPIVSQGTSINVGDFGFLMTDEENKIENIVDTVKKVVTMSDEEYVNRVYRTLENSIIYSQSSFTKTFTTALLKVMKSEKRFN